MALPTSYNNVVNRLGVTSPADAPYKPYTPIQNIVQTNIDATRARMNSGTYENNIAALEKQIRALQNSYKAEPVAPYFNTVANYNQARQRAEASVNPLYTKKINDFLARQKVELGRKQTDINTANTRMDQMLNDAMELSGQTRTRTTEDVTNNMSELANKEDNFQTDSGQSFDRTLQALRGNVANAGLTTSGLGQQQVAGATAAQNTDEARKAESFNVERRNQQLFKTRTFEDLSRSDKMKERETEFGKGQNKIDLDRYIEDQKYQEGNTRAEMEVQRLIDIMNNTRSYEQAGFRNFLGSLGQQKQGLALKSYGGYYA